MLMIVHEIKSFIYFILYFTVSIVFYLQQMCGLDTLTQP